jgi:riboflavin biosynthesis pyrimidine reductase
MILSEGGPTLFTSLLASGLVDELFLTMSPLLAGRALQSRLPLVEGVELLPDATQVLRLLSARRHENHLFLRYGLTPVRRGEPANPTASSSRRDKQTALNE